MELAVAVAGFMGMALSAVGVWFAFFANRAAGGAREAAEAAHQAIRKSLTGVEAGRAAGLIDRILTLNRHGHWQAAINMYGDLRAMLSDLHESQIDKEGGMAVELRRAREQVRAIEDALDGLADTPEAASLLAKANRHLADTHELMLTIQSQSLIGQESA